MKIYGVPGVNGLGKTKGLDVTPSKFLKDSEIVELNNENLELQEKQIYNFISNLELSEERKVFLGGDHSISYPLVQYFFENFLEGRLLVFDAHPDLMPSMKEPTHEEWLRAIVERGGISGRDIMIVGVRRNSENIDKREIEYAKSKGIKIIYSDEFFIKGEEIKDFVFGSEKVYCSFDFDVFDSSIFSATGYPEEKGLKEEETLGFLKDLKKNLFWIDLVEYNFFFDHDKRGFKIVEKVLKTLK